MEIRLLGPVEVHASDMVFRCSRPQEAVALAMLAEQVGRPVTVETLVAGVWADASPLRAARIMNTHITRIRRMLEKASEADGTEMAGVTRRGGSYVLEIAPEHVDLHRFRSLLVQAERHDGLEQHRLVILRQALALWHGEPLTGLRGTWAELTRHAWNQQRQAALLAWGQVELRAGDRSAVISALTPEVARNGLVEPMIGQLMQALALTGRGAEAAELYAATCRRLADELGMDPGSELRTLHQAILRGELDTDTVEARVVPRQLPADVSDFTGRVRELAQLDVVAASPRTAVAISVVSGTAGIGKTALAVHWAHRNAKRFPDGQLYVNLRGFGPGDSMMDPADAIRGFLDALAVPAERIPADRDAQAGLYRTLLADRKMLVVLDNARDGAHVRPLLPAAPECLVLVTSRDRLTSVIATTGAHPMSLDLLTPDEARDLLCRRIGAHRVAADPDAVDALITQCARLPLALALVAARAATNSQLPLESLTDELADIGTRLDALAERDSIVDLRAVFSWSYTALTPAAARLFRLLGLHPGPDISSAAAGSLAALSQAEVRPLLAELASANLIVEHRPGRYTFHDLLRAYAAGLADHTDTIEERQAATMRMLDHYLHTTHTADRLLAPGRDPITLTPPQPGTAPEAVSTIEQARDWFIAERLVVLATFRFAASHRMDTHTWQLAWALKDHLYRTGQWQDAAAIQSTALAAAQRLGDRSAQIKIHRLLATAYLDLGNYDEARSNLQWGP